MDFIACTSGRLSVGLGFLLLASGCGSSSPGEVFASKMEAEGMHQVEVQFTPVVNGERWTCSGTYMIGNPAAPARPQQLRIFVYDVALTGPAGRTQLMLDPDDFQGNFPEVKQNVALLDFDDATGNCRFADPETHVAITGWAPKGTYTGLSFRIGVPSELNHIDAGLAPSPMNRPGLWWAWKAGNILIRADWDSDMNDSHRPRTAADTSAPPGWQLWLAEAGYGSQACTGEIDQGYSCPNQFQPKVELDGFDAASDQVALDVGVLLQDIDLNRTQWDTSPEGRDPEITDPTVTGYPMPDYYAGCFTDRVDGECAVAFKHLGIDWMTLSAPDATKQDFVRKAAQ